MLKKILLILFGLFVGGVLVVGVLWGFYQLRGEKEKAPMIEVDNLGEKTAAAKYFFPIEDYILGRAGTPYGQKVEGEAGASGYRVGDEVVFFASQGEIPVYALTSGEIMKMETDEILAGVIIIGFEDEGAKYEAVYGGVDLETVDFKVGDAVEAGEKIGLITVDLSTGGDEGWFWLSIFKGEGAELTKFVPEEKELGPWQDPVEFLQGRQASPVSLRIGFSEENKYTGTGYQNQIYHFGLDVPEGWVLLEHNYTEPQSPGEARLATIQMEVPEPRPEDPRELSQLMRRKCFMERFDYELGGELSGFVDKDTATDGEVTGYVEESREDFETAQSYPGIEIVSRISTGANFATIKRDRFWVQVNKNIFKFTCDSTEQTWNEDEPVFGQIAESFEILSK